MVGFKKRILLVKTKVFLIKTYLINQTITYYIVCSKLTLLLVGRDVCEFTVAQLPSHSTTNPHNKFPNSRVTPVAYQQIIGHEKIILLAEC